MKDKLTKEEMKKTTGGGEEIGIGLDAGWECLDCGSFPLVLYSTAFYLALNYLLLS